jgi:predicted metal-dependent phosphoesterase TrpH
MKKIDLHTHTTFSDGRLPPNHLIKLAEKNNLDIVAVTDHETVEGFKKIKVNKKVRIIPGIEISCSGIEFNFFKIDVLGLFINPYNKKLTFFLNKNFRKRSQLLKFIRRTIQKIIFLELITKFILNLFRKIFLYTKFNLRYPSLEETIKIINNSGGIAVLAHPGIIPTQNLGKVIEHFAKYGGKAVEVNYPYSKTYFFTEEEQKLKINEIKKLAKKYKLFFSGGSDFHGGERKVTVGEEGITLEEFEKLEGLINVSKSS